MTDRFEMPYCNRAGIVIPALLFAMAGVCLGFAVTGYYTVRYLILLALVFCMVGITVSRRFRMVRFIYMINDIPVGDPPAYQTEAGEEIWYLHILQTAFGRQKTVYSIPSCDIRLVEPGKWTRRDRKAHADLAQDTRIVRENFCTNLFSPYCVKVFYFSDDRLHCVILEADEIFIHSLQAMCRE